MPPKGVWEGPHMIIHFVNDVDVVPFPAPLCLPCLVTFCACEVCSFPCFRDGELNPTSIKEVGLSCGGSNNHLSTMS
eukprot:scaffold30062_cov143-Isochrysis_galbana.AAC.1